MKLRLPADATIDAEVDLGTTDGGYGLAARLDVRLPGIDRKTAQALVDAAHDTARYRAMEERP
jgi:organic hydroperoxide reductase OsmC/OhrA